MNNYINEMHKNREVSRNPKKVKSVTWKQVDKETHTKIIEIRDFFKEEKLELQYSRYGNMNLTELLKIFTFLNININEIPLSRSEDIFSFIQKYLLSVQQRRHGTIRDENEEKEVKAQYEQLIQSKVFKNMKKEYFIQYKEKLHPVLYNLEAEMIALSHEKRYCSWASGTRKGIVFSCRINRLYENILTLLEIFPLDIENIHTIKNMALFFKANSLYINGNISKKGKDAYETIHSFPSVTKAIKVYEKKRLNNPDIIIHK